MSLPEDIWRQLLAGPNSDMLLQDAMRQVATGLSDMMMQPVDFMPPKIKRIPIARVANHVGAPETEIVGIYLRIETGLRGQALMMLPLYNFNRTTPVTRFWVTLTNASSASRS